MKNRVSITAEFSSLIQSELDSRNLYFVSSTTQHIYRLLRKILPNTLLRNIFLWRQNLSQKFDLIVEKERPEQIIDLGAGYSLRGFNLCLGDTDLIYIDSDFSDVISRKKQIIDSLCEKEEIAFPKNLHFVAIDVLHDDIFLKVKNELVPDKKTLIIAEGVTSYFSAPELRSFFLQIQNTLTKFSLASFYSSENLTNPKGSLYKVVRKSLALFTHSRDSHQFKNTEEFKNFLKECGIIDYKIEDSDSGHLMYSIIA
jgi:O-methyltransferase involved in polyketide biosynthesis